MLIGIKLVDSPRSGLQAAGLALFVGWTTTALGFSLGLVVGVEPRLQNAILLWLSVGLIAVFALRRAPLIPSERKPLKEAKRPGRIVALLGAGVLAGALVALLVRSWSPTGVLHPDAWDQWFAKAKVLYFFGGLDTGVGGFTSQYNPDYPPLDPTSEALVFDAIGGANTLELARFHWALAASFVLALAWILRPRVRPAILWPSLALLVLAPAFASLIGSSLADEPLSFLIGLAGVTGIVWLLEDDPRWVLLSGLFLAAATATKNEGLMLALVMVVALALTKHGRRHIGAIAGLIGAVAAVYGVWRIWLNRHSVPQNPFYDLGDIFDLGYMLGRIDRFQYALGELVEQLITPSRWLLIVPATVVLALLATRRAPEISVFVLTVIALDLVGFASVYWLSDVDLHFYVDNTVDRLPAFFVVFCGSLLPLLLSVTAPTRPTTDRPSDWGVRAAGD